MYLLVLFSLLSIVQFFFLKTQFNMPDEARVAKRIAKLLKQ